MLGIDISNNNGNLNLTNVFNNGIQVVYIKLSEGKSFTDKNAKGFYEQCKSKGIKVGAYHFLVGTSSISEQVNHFYELYKQYDFDCIPMLDAETNFNGLTNGIKQFKEEFESLSGVKLGLYTYTSFINSYFTNCDSEIYNMPLWEANYNNNPWILPSNNFKVLVGHQYSEKGIVADFKGDCNYFNENVLIKSESEWKQDSTGWWYVYSNGTYPKSTWFKVDNDWYYADEQGYCYQNRWLKDNDKWYYFNHECKMVSNKTITYSFNEKGEWINE